MRKRENSSNRFVNRLIICIIVIGIAILLYPVLSNYLAEKNQGKVIISYYDEVSGISQELLDKEWQKAKKYNDILAGRVVNDIFLEGSGRALPEDYYNVLNVNGVMAVLRIPVINLELPVYHGTGERVLKRGAGHIAKTALPIGGLGNHSVITGHRALLSAKLFTDLDNLSPGEVFYIDVLGETLAYEIDQILTVEPEDITELLPVQGEDYITLVTCTPYAVNSHRLLVRGTRIPYDKDAVVMAEENIPSWWCLIFGVLLLLLLLLFLIRRRKKRKDEEIELSI